MGRLVFGRFWLDGWVWFCFIWFGFIGFVWYVWFGRLNLSRFGFTHFCKICLFCIFCIFCVFCVIGIFCILCIFSKFCIFHMFCKTSNVSINVWFGILFSKGQIIEVSTRSWVSELVADMGRLWQDLCPDIPERYVHLFWHKGLVFYKTRGHFRHRMYRSLVRQGHRSSRQDPLTSHSLQDRAYLHQIAFHGRFK